MSEYSGVVLIRPIKTRLFGMHIDYVTFYLPNFMNCFVIEVLGAIIHILAAYMIIYEFNQNTLGTCEKCAVPNQEPQQNEKVFAFRRNDKLVVIN